MNKILDDIVKMSQNDPNTIRLNSCHVPHYFMPVVVNATNDKNSFNRFFCEKCKGEVPADAAIWYDKGILDGPRR